MKKTLLFLTAILFLLNTITRAQFELWGTTSSGGENYTGTIFKTDVNGENLEVEYNFKVIPGQEPTYNNLLEALNGKLYGMTTKGGEYGSGDLFEYNPITEEYNVKVNFSDENSMGHEPNGSLIQASNGKLYGMTTYGGENNYGTIFEYDIETETHIKLFDFGGEKGEEPYGSLLQASNGKLYGMTRYGGSENNGTLFEFDIDTKTSVVQFDFNNTTGINPNGSLIQCSNGKLYGLTKSGGENYSGVLFEFDIQEETLTKLIDFEETTTGSNPYGSLLEASDGKLYGLNRDGGTNNDGVLYSYNIEDDTFSVLVNFDISTNAAEFYGSLIQASNNKLYGLSASGGDQNDGTLFEYNIDDNSLIVKVDFEEDSRGENPLGTLIQASNGKLYGLTSSGGAVNQGVLFEYNLSDNKFNKKIDFGSSPNGSSPVGKLLKTSNGKLYGVTSAGGSFDDGVIYEYDPLYKTCTTLYNFKYETGSNPTGSLVELENGTLYGTTEYGGSGTCGVLFKFDPNSKDYTPLIEFSYETIARFPGKYLTLADNGRIYGTLRYGNGDNQGVLYEFDPSSEDTIIVKFEFMGGSSQYNPIGGVMQASNGKLYGSTGSGPIGYYGTVYKFDIENDSYNKLATLNGNSTGKSIKSLLIESSNGKLYGVASSGGSSGDGLIFQVDTTTNTYSVKAGFNSTNTGEIPSESMLESSNGKMYGLAYRGGENNNGTLYEYDPVNNTLTKKYDFDYESTGSNPGSSLIEICPPKITFLKDTITNGDSIYLGNAYQKTTGTYYDTLYTICGSDSIIATELYVKDINNAIVEINSIDEAFKLYPNPANNYINIQINDEIIQNVVIYNLSGQIVEIKKSGNLNLVNLDKLNQGSYIIKVVTEKKFFSKIFIKQ